MLDRFDDVFEGVSRNRPRCRVGGVRGREAEVGGERATQRSVGEYVTQPLPADGASRVVVEVGLEAVGGVAPDRSGCRLVRNGPEEVKVPGGRLSGGVEDAL